MCFSVSYVELSVSHTSVLIILAITVERYYAICLPFKSKAQPCTESRAIFTCLVAWLVAFGLTAPVLVMSEYKSDSGNGDPTCSLDVNLFWQKIYFIILITVFFFIPLIILIGLYRNIARHLVPQEEQVLFFHKQSYSMVKCLALEYNVTSKVQDVCLISCFRLLQKLLRCYAHDNKW